MLKLMQAQKKYKQFRNEQIDTLHHANTLMPSHWQMGDDNLAYKNISIYLEMSYKNSIIIIVITHKGS